ncbi:hypothetical protein MNEG_4302 [Monoraphidium neglectum]|uniref:RRM domain-containing protein n=1 Tax=Monoraphidium neglectum TaxID=145388 RepID=A0A0D2LA82_9CHLO|nr:hypothetical protein MNEG_4302 [Monoraphidium neglectum]KIZ03659.1 hypothetical protein MNEG_4302 [Monoraphidium neglectum]|eukprot:XP_013902678.1 hypothetical protein MNEG_4302 [Monoraphidium neglectum]
MPRDHGGGGGFDRDRDRDHGGFDRDRLDRRHSGGSFDRHDRGSYERERGGGGGGFDRHGSSGFDRYGSGGPVLYDRHGGAPHDRYGGGGPHDNGGGFDPRYGRGHERGGGGGGGGGEPAGGFERLRRPAIRYRVQLSNLATTTTWADIKMFLKAAGDCVYACAPGDGTAVGEFATVEECRAALEKLQDVALDGMRVRIAAMNFDERTGQRTDLDEHGNPRPDHPGAHGRGGDWGHANGDAAAAGSGSRDRSPCARESGSGEGRGGGGGGGGHESDGRDPANAGAPESIYFAYGAHYEASRRGRDDQGSRDDAHDAKRPRGSPDGGGGGSRERGLQQERGASEEKGGWTRVA